MIDNLSEEQKENMQTAHLHGAEQALQNEIAIKKKYAKTPSDFIEALTLEYARPVCNECKSVIRLYEMSKFNRNGGYCVACKTNLSKESVN
jgi:hypothetical protein